jgi:hypothetical protein
LQEFPGSALECHTCYWLPRRCPKFGGAEALAIALSQEIDMLLSDIGMPENDASGVALFLWRSVQTRQLH